MRMQIDCINKEPRLDPYHRIQYVGGPSPDGTRWKKSSSAAIAEIESGRSSFYVSQSGGTVDVVVATRLDHKYLKTKADGETPDNLLSLKECA